MQLFIFGAGASFGSQGAVDLRAPLINNLFSGDYANAAMTAGFRGAELRELMTALGPSGDLEAWLTMQWEGLEQLKGKSRQARQMQFGRIAFYIWLILVQASLRLGLDVYGRLIAKLITRDPDFGFVDFNYDVLLDRAYSRRVGGVTLDSLDAYIRHDIIKPHGSVNWFLRPRFTDPKMPLREQEADIPTRIETAVRHMFSDDGLTCVNEVVYDPWHGDPYRSEFIANDVFSRQYSYPLILLPLSSKMYGYVTGFDRIIEGGKTLAARATEVFIIGYRARDTIIRTILSDVPRGTVLHVVGMGEAAAIAAEIITWQPNFTAGSICEMGFESFVDNF